LACGFYWTEGLRGLGWAVDAVPTLKAGSTVGIPSPPAIWKPGTDEIVTPDLGDVERLQGFPAGWTAVADRKKQGRRSTRWKLVGNAVSVPVAEWLGQRLGETTGYDQTKETNLVGERWPRAAWGRSGVRRAVAVSMWPVHRPRPHLWDFLDFDPRPLSARATAGFLERADRGNLRIDPKMIREAQEHLAKISDALPIAA
jgi:DNA (cytosine-5)-methyltransferase 1